MKTTFTANFKYNVTFKNSNISLYSEFLAKYYHNLLNSATNILAQDSFQVLILNELKILVILTRSFLLKFGSTSTSIQCISYVCLKKIHVIQTFYIYIVYMTKIEIKSSRK